MNEKEWYKNMRPLGKLFYKMGLIFYDPISFDGSNIDFSWKYWHIAERIVCHFKGHNPEQYYRLPKDGEVGLIDKCGTVKAEIRCHRCFRITSGGNSSS